MVLGNTLSILRPPDRSTPPIQTGWNEDLVKNMHNVLGRMSQEIVAQAALGLNIVTDTTPQLGGNLDVNGKEITSASDGDVVINPDGTGGITLSAAVKVDSAGGTDADITETGIDRNSGSSETFNVQNSGAGDMTLQVDGSEVAKLAGPAFTGSVSMAGELQIDAVVQTPADVITSETGISLSMTGPNKKTIALATNTTITVADEIVDQVVEVWITQTSGGGTAAWSGVDKWVGGSAPTLSTTTGQIDIIVLAGGPGPTIIAQHLGVAS